jgi:hypothetical protein
MRYFKQTLTQRGGPPSVGCGTPAQPDDAADQAHRSHDAGNRCEKEWLRGGGITVTEPLHFA